MLPRFFKAIPFHNNFDVRRENLILQTWPTFESLKAINQGVATRFNEDLENLLVLTKLDTPQVFCVLLCKFV